MPLPDPSPTPAPPLPHPCPGPQVLLYLEHAARAEPFKFDPLLAPELRGAAVALGVAGLQVRPYH